MEQRRDYRINWYALLFVLFVVTMVLPRPLVSVIPPNVPESYSALSRQLVVHFNGACPCPERTA